jgi:hypothetical protein
VCDGLSTGPALRSGDDHVDLGRSGVTSVSAGTRGAHYTVGRHGPRATIGLPGTGTSYTMTPHHRRRHAAARHGSILGGLVVLFLFYLLIRALAGV